jgi:pimeloyl-ACP methyl ester carboxylesterase
MATKGKIITLDPTRRRVLGVGALALASAQFGGISVLKGATMSTTTLQFSAFGPLKQVDAGSLNIGYIELGPTTGPVVLLLHGWPYDIYSFEASATMLAARGNRVIVPYLRGFGTTRMRFASDLRNGQPVALAFDVIALMDALKISKAVIGGFDWGARTANIVAALWPERCRAMVSVSGYLIGNQEAGKVPLPPEAELQWWYQYYFATERGRVGYGSYRREFAKLIWKSASPRWKFDDATFDRTASSFDNADHVGIVIHNYRWRLGWRKERRNTTSGKGGSHWLRS